MYIHSQNTNLNLNPPVHYNKQDNQNTVNIIRICITGGPCAGKTTAIAAIKQDLTQLGMKVLVVPEAASALMRGGANIVSGNFTETQGVQFQKSLMKLQFGLEDTFYEIAKMAGSY